MRKSIRAILEVILLVIFVITLWLSIKWSDYPIWTMPFGIEKIFLRPAIVDASMLNLATGYVSGYIVYLLTAVFPQTVRARPIVQSVRMRLHSIYSSMLFMLLLMYKNASTELEWAACTCERDIECFDEAFYDVMTRFNCKEYADTILLHKDEKTPIKWYEKMQLEFDVFFNELDSLFNAYQGYLPDELLVMIDTLKREPLVEMFTGHYSSIVPATEGADEYCYYDRIPVTMYMGQDNMNGNMFASQTNSRSLRNFVDRLNQLHSIKSKIRRSSGEKHEWILELRTQNVGHISAARKELSMDGEQ